MNKGKGIVLEVLEDISFGKLYFQVAIIFRNSLLVSSILCNSEVWFNITNTQLDCGPNVFEKQFWSSQNNTKGNAFLRIGSSAFERHHKAEKTELSSVYLESRS